MCWCACSHCSRDAVPMWTWMSNRPLHAVAKCFGMLAAQHARSACWRQNQAFSSGRPCASISVRTCDKIRAARVKCKRFDDLSMEQGSRMLSRKHCAAIQSVAHTGQSPVSTTTIALQMPRLWAGSASNACVPAAVSSTSSPSIDLVLCKAAELTMTGGFTQGGVDSDAYNCNVSSGHPQ